MKKGRLENIGRVLLFIAIPLLVLLLTSVETLASWVVNLAVFGLLVSIALSFFKENVPQVAKTGLNVLIVVLLVGGTGWFLSPFFFFLYLIPVYLGFLYAPIVSFSFLAVMLVIFSTTSVGEVDVAYDIMTILSLLLVVPLIFYLRRKYLVIRQSKRDILIIDEGGSRVKDADSIGRLLSNRITNLGVTIRQPLTFVKQAATVLLEENLDAKEATKYVKRIRTTASEALEQIRHFEGDTSANEVLTNRRNPKRSPTQKGVVAKKTVTKPTRRGADKKTNTLKK